MVTLHALPRHKVPAEDRNILRHLAAKGAAHAVVVELRDGEQLQVLQNVFFSHQPDKLKR